MPLAGKSWRARQHTAQANTLYVRSGGECEISRLARIFHTQSAFHVHRFTNISPARRSPSEMRAKTKPLRGFDLSPDTKRARECRNDHRTECGSVHEASVSLFLRFVFFRDDLPRARARNLARARSGRLRARLRITSTIPLVAAASRGVKNAG